jgi:predicted SnoaL-like aldol condensation-catalyzing enzyme
MSQGPQPGAAAMIAFYRFVDGRIAEDWGVSTRTPWQR